MSRQVDRSVLAISRIMRQLDDFSFSQKISILNFVLETIRNGAVSYDMMYDEENSHTTALEKI